MGFPLCARPLPCDCVRGECDELTGQCVCPVNFAGPACERCAEGFGGEDCASVAPLAWQVALWRGLGAALVVLLLLWLCGRRLRRWRRARPGYTPVATAEVQHELSSRAAGGVDERGAGDEDSGADDTDADGVSDQTSLLARGRTRRRQPTPGAAPARTDQAEAGPARSAYDPHPKPFGGVALPGLHRE